MATLSQIDANRENATHSTGPKTESGKARSAQNALRHGLASGQLIIEGESQEDLDALLADLMAEHQPSTATETLLVRQMAQHFWLSQRAIRLQTKRLNQSDYIHVDFPVLLRYQGSNERAFHKDLAALLKLKKERNKAEIGSVSQTARKASQPPSQHPRPESEILPIDGRPTPEITPIQKGDG